MSEHASPVELLREVQSRLTGPGGMYEVVASDAGLGYPVRVFKNAPNDLNEIWRSSVRHRDREYLVYEDERLTYGQMETEVARIAGALRTELGIRRQDRVAIAMRNYPEWVIAHWAVLSLGAVVVGMNAWWTGPELARCLEAGSPTVLIADEERLTAFRQIRKDFDQSTLPPVVAVRTGLKLGKGEFAWGDFQTSPSQAPTQVEDLSPTEDAVLFYTSGSTGLPKGVRLSHRACVHNLWHLMYWKTATREIETPSASQRKSGKKEHAVFMAPTPLFHVTACNCVMHPATLAGAKLVLTHHWDPARALELIERERVTNFSGVPTMNRDLISHPDWASRDTSSLTNFVSGGAPLPPDLDNKIKASIRKGALSTGYGMTESAGVVTANSSMFGADKPGSCGPLLPTVEAMLVDNDGLPVAGQDATGELCVRGPIITSGYMSSERTEDALSSDGWFRTGDVARIDRDSFVFIVDRVKDVIIRGGENVWAAEVERAIYATGCFSEVAVIGVPDERLGEKVGAVLVADLDEVIDVDKLGRMLQGRLARHKIPEVIRIQVEPLPRTASGKIDKSRIRSNAL